MPEAVIVETARTPIGRALKGSLKDVRPDDMGGFIIKDLMGKVPAVEPTSVDDVMMGSANHSGEQGMNHARNCAALAGLPDTVPGTSVNRFCASSLQTIRMAFHAIKAGEGDTYIAGGLESGGAREGDREVEGSLVDDGGDGGRTTQRRQWAAAESPRKKGGSQGRPRPSQAIRIQARQTGCGSRRVQPWPRSSEA